MKHFEDNGKLKLLIIVGTRPEIIRLATVIKKYRKYFDCLLAHMVYFFHDLELDDPDIYMEAGNRCKDECLPEETNRRIIDIISNVNMAYSEHARRYLADCGLPKECTYATGFPMAEVLHDNLDKIEAFDVHEKLVLEKGKYILLSVHIEENIDTEENFLSLFNAINDIAEKYDKPILYSCHPRSRKRLEQSRVDLNLILELFSMSHLDFMIWIS